MASFNQVILMGNVTRDPQLKQLPNGGAVCDFGLAVNRKYRTGAGEDKEETCFVDCTAFGKQAEVLAQYITKGKPLFVDGRLKYDTWEDAKSGAKRSKLSVIIDNFQFVGSRDGGEGGAPQSDRAEAPRQSSGGTTKFHPKNRPGRAPDGPAQLQDPRSPEAIFQSEDVPFRCDPALWHLRTL